MDKTCKSNAIYSVAILGMSSGARVRNTWVICREDWDNPEKSGLIPDVIEIWHQDSIKGGDLLKGLPFHDKPAAYQLVG